MQPTIALDGNHFFLLDLFLGQIKTVKLQILFHMYFVRCLC